MSDTPEEDLVKTCPECGVRIRPAFGCVDCLLKKLDDDTLNHVPPKKTFTMTAKVKLDDERPREWLAREIYAKWARHEHDEMPNEFISRAEYAAVVAERDDLSVKLQRTVNAARHALLEMTAWMGIPEHKRETQINEFMSNVEFCAKHDLRHVDESQLVQQMRRLSDADNKRIQRLEAALKVAKQKLVQLEFFGTLKLVERLEKGELE